MGPSNIPSSSYVSRGLRRALTPRTASVPSAFHPHSSTSVGFHANIPRSSRPTLYVEGHRVCLPLVAYDGKHTLFESPPSASYFGGVQGKLIEPGAGVATLVPGEDCMLFLRAPSDMSSVTHVVADMQSSRIGRVYPKSRFKTVVCGAYPTQSLESHELYGVTCRATVVARSGVA
jgi:hypothetical protein